MRLCFHGSSRISDVNKFESLNECQLFYTTNETLSRVTTLQIILIKVINITKPLKIGENTHYNGRWALAFAENSLSDELIYKEHGDYLRYIASRTIISITLSEQPFYLQNIQQPIVRRSELAFHTLLFCTLIIELFAMAFFLFRLLCVPFMRFIRRCYSPQLPNTAQPELAPVSHTQHIIVNVDDTSAY